MIDAFLFDSRRGFCEHYASSFVIMMRMAGIPARVVTGYQGGVDNGEYLLVKQSDAHAWTEVYIEPDGENNNQIEHLTISALMQFVLATPAYALDAQELERRLAGHSSGAEAHADMALNNAIHDVLLPMQGDDLATTAPLLEEVLRISQ